MRQRYYNPEIKRFVNQDILTGSLDNSQSLNRYSYVQGNPVSYTDPFGLSPLNGLFSGTNFAHAVLGLLSCVPGYVGAGASLIDAAIYLFVDKDYGMAALCAMRTLSFGLGQTASLLAKGGTMTRTASVLSTASSLMSRTATFGMNAIAGMDTGFAMYEKYVIQGQSVGWDTLAEVGTLGLSVAGCLISGKGMAADTKRLGNMLSDAGFMDGMKKEVCGLANGVKEFALDNRGGVNFGGGSTPSSGKTYYHVTTEENAQKIMESGELGVRGNRWETRVFAWTQQPTQSQASIAGISSKAQTVIKFETNASFEPDIGNARKSIRDIVVQTTDGQRVPILVRNTENVGFKKEWWQFWKK